MGRTYVRLVRQAQQPRERRSPLHQPVELRLPPLDIVGTSRAAESIDVACDRIDDGIDHRIVGHSPVTPTEEPDATGLLAKRQTVGTEVEPKEERIAKILQPAARPDAVEVDDPHGHAVAEDEVAR